MRSTIYSEERKTVGNILSWQLYTKAMCFVYETPAEENGNNSNIEIINQTLKIMLQFSCCSFSCLYIGTHRTTKIFCFFIADQLQRIFCFSAFLGRRKEFFVE